MKTKTKKRLKLALIILLIFVISFPTVQMPLATVIIYESIFHRRYETAPWQSFEPSDFPGLSCETFCFPADGEELAGYLYSTEEARREQKGVVIISHGHGGGGQNSLMPFADEFARNGYLVFAYDAFGNDNSPGFVGGLPRGVIALSAAIDRVASIPELSGLPIMLFGHSWGAYSGANVLKLHPEIAAAAFISGFNESEDMLLFYARQYVGGFADLTIPYLSLYERLKFGGGVTRISGAEGMAASDAPVLIAHSADDATVPTFCGYEDYLLEFSGDPRFTFAEFSDQGHVRILYSDESDRRTDELNAMYADFVSQNGGEPSEELKLEFMESLPSLLPFFTPDGELMEDVVEMFNTASTEHFSEN